MAGSAATASSGTHGQIVCIFPPTAYYSTLCFDVRGSRQARPSATPIEADPRLPAASSKSAAKEHEQDTTRHP